MAEPSRVVVDRLLERPPHLATARLLALDGAAGSGKTSLARAVASRLAAADRTVEVVGLDDLYDGWSGPTTDLERRVVDQLLTPLAGGGTARWQSYDWAHERFDGWHDLVRPDVVVLEGCGAGALPYAPFTSLLVWVTADAAVRRRRALARDGDLFAPHWAAWAATEARYAAAHDPQRRADLVVTT